MPPKTELDTTYLSWPAKIKYWLFGFNTICFVSNNEDWKLYFRCKKCSTGYFIVKTTRSPEELITGNDRWICKHCGSGFTSLVKWIGRRRRILFTYVTEWMSEEDLPEDLKPKKDLDARAESVLKETDQLLKALKEQKV